MALPLVVTPVSASVKTIEGQDDMNKQTQTTKKASGSLTMPHRQLEQSGGSKAEWDDFNAWCKTKKGAKPELPRTFNEALQHAKEAIGFFANGDLSEIAAIAKKLWYILDDVQQGKNVARLNSAEALAEALRAWEYAKNEGGISMVDWFEVAWKKTQAALAQWEAGQ